MGILFKRGIISAIIAIIACSASSILAQTQPATAPAPVSKPAGGPGMLQRLISGLSGPTATPSPAPEPADAAAQDEGTMLVNSLIDSLSNGDADAQQDARKQLLQMGDLALAPLQKLIRTTGDNGIRQRAQVVLEELESHFVFKPTMVTLKMDNVHPREVFKELAKQGGIAIEPGYDFWNQNRNGMPRKISVDIQNQPFWLAFIDVAKKAQVYPVHNGRDDQITIYQGGGNLAEGQRFLSGPIVFVLASITRTVSFNGPAASKSLNVQYQAFSDPKLKIIDGSYFVKLSEASGDKGLSMIVPDQPDNSTTSGNGWQWHLTSQLVYDTAANTKIAKLKGTARFKIRSSAATIEIPNVADEKTKGQTFTAGTWKVTLKDFKKTGDGNNGQYELSVVADNSSPANDGSFEWPQASSMHLMDDKGQSYDVRGTNENGSQRQIQLTLHYGKRNNNGKLLGEPVKWVWQMTTGTRNIRIPVEFSDVPLPNP